MTLIKQIIPIAIGTDKIRNTNYTNLKRISLIKKISVDLFDQCSIFLPEHSGSVFLFFYYIKVFLRKMSYFYPAWGMQYTYNVVFQ